MNHFPPSAYFLAGHAGERKRERKTEHKPSRLVKGQVAVFPAEITILDNIKNCKSILSPAFMSFVLVTVHNIVYFAASCCTPPFLVILALMHPFVFALCLYTRAQYTLIFTIDDSTFALT